MQSKTLQFKTIDSGDLGEISLVASSVGLVGLCWGKPNAKDYSGYDLVEVKKADKNPVIVAAETQIKEYVRGESKNFSIPFDFLTGTPFQKKVWKELLKLKFGQTWTYGELAKRIGDSKKARAVGGAVGANPIPIIIPCHRIIGSQGKLTGFSSGIHLKIKLLKKENIHWFKN